MQQLIVFETGARQLAIKVEDVVEIIRVVEITAVPEIEPPFAGYINYRGTVVPVVRVAHLLGLNSACSPLNEQMILAGRDGVTQVCLVVDQVLTFVTADQIEPLPGSGQNPAQVQLTPELVRFGSSLVPALNLEALLARARPTFRPVVREPVPQFSEN